MLNSALTVPEASRRERALAAAFSSAVRNHAVAGDAGSQKNATRAISTVMPPAIRVRRYHQILSDHAYLR